jgi:hypothetical protein
METLAECPPASSSFASLLASLAVPKGPDAAFDDSNLAPDVASLSYESALRAHARYRVADPVPASASTDLPAVPRSLSEFLEILPQTACDDLPEHEPFGHNSFGHDPSGHDSFEDDSPYRPSPQPRRDSPAQNQALRSASVTVRFSAEESARLRRRAAEAGLTLSAYLRSCTFEVESLRAQVKQTLAEMRSSEAGPRRLGASKPTGRGKSLLCWLRGTLPRRRSVRHALPA